jgi:hypothetical protein
VEDVRDLAAGQAKKELRVEAVRVDLLEVDLDVDPGDLLLNCRGSLLDVLRLETRLVGIADVDRPGDRAAGFRGQSGRAARRDECGRGRQLQKSSTGESLG